jgi:hypothetical protein
MNTYRVRVHDIGWRGFFTQADHFEDHQLASAEPFDEFARRLAREGFLHEESGKWIMPGAIMWVEPLR